MESGRKIGKNSRKDLIAKIHTKKEQFFTLPPLSSFAPVVNSQADQGKGKRLPPLSSFAPVANTAKRSKKAPFVAGSSVVLRIARYFVLFAGILESEPGAVWRRVGGGGCVTSARCVCVVVVVWWRLCGVGPPEPLLPTSSPIAAIVAAVPEEVTAMLCVCVGGVFFLVCCAFRSRSGRSRPIGR